MLLDRVMRLFGVPFLLKDTGKRSPDGGEYGLALAVASAGRSDWRTSFAATIASGLDTSYWTQLCVGSGMTVSQSAGNANLVSGTTANAETIYRSKEKFSASGMRVSWQASLSQRIINQQFIVELVDVLGDGLAFTINSATSVTVSFPVGTNPFNATNVGQSVSLGNFTGTAGTIPGRYAIASTAGDTVTFTVAGFPGAGSGTVSLFGWNFHRINYNGATATSLDYDTGRAGWASGSTTVSINTSAAPGHLGVMGVDDCVGYLNDQLVASSIGAQTSVRGSRVINVPDPDTEMYLQVRMVNGSTAPLSTTTWTLGRVAVQCFTSNPVSIDTVRPQSRQEAMPANVVNTVFVNASGPAAEDAVASGNPVMIGGIARAGTAPTTIVAGDVVRPTMTLGAALVEKPYSVPEADWSFVGPVAGITTGADTVAKAAGAAGIRNYVTNLQVSNASATAGELQIKDGATVLWRGWLQANQIITDITFTTPLRGTAATALNVQAVTTGMVAVVDLQGYQAQ